MNLFQNKKILIIDDNSINIKVLGTILDKENFQIFVSQNGIQALENIEKIMPDLILLDVLMPEMDGFETCKRLKENPNVSDIPVIFLTAKAEIEDMIKGFELGAADYLTKPFNPKELIVRISTHLELKITREQIKKSNQNQKELIHILCHDLLNPLNSILSVLNLMEKLEDFNRYKDLLKSSTLNGLNMLKMVADMQSLEEYDLQLEPVSLNKAVKMVNEILKNMLTEKQVDLEIDIPDDINILADYTSLVNSVLNNLITNAIKFSHTGSKIMISAHKDNNEVFLNIKDKGVGIPPHILKDIFRIDKQTTRLGTNGEEGKGFGMPLVKKFINQYKGEISISSDDGSEDKSQQGTLIQMKFQSA